MDRRAVAPLIFALLLLKSLYGCGRAEAPQFRLGVGDPAPAEWTPGIRPARTYLAWIARTEDCLSCQDMDYEFRRVQVRWRDVPLVVVHVGSVASESVPRAFLGSRRVQATFLTRSPRAFAARYGDVAVPSVHLVHDGVIVWSSADLRSRPAPRVPLDSLVALHAGR